VFAGRLRDVDGPVDVVAVDLRWLLDTFSYAGLYGLVIDYVRFGDEVVDEFRVGERIPNECAGATACRGGLACRLDVVFFDVGS
jgi:hypothetical protein